jgi:hypothetical protein
MQTIDLHSKARLYQLFGYCEAWKEGKPLERALKDRVARLGHESAMQFTGCHLPFPSLLNQFPRFVWSKTVIETQEIEEITRTPPGVTIPMLVASTEHLKAWSHITAVVVVFERTRADPSTIKCHIATDHRSDILCLAPLPDTCTAFMACHRNQHP